jgi:predicted GNAT superfamily acetyltransferase
MNSIPSVGIDFESMPLCFCEDLEAYDNKKWRPCLFFVLPGRRPDPHRRHTTLKYVVLTLARVFWLSRGYDPGNGSAFLCNLAFAAGDWIQSICPIEPGRDAKTGQMSTLQIIHTRKSKKFLFKVESSAHVSDFAKYESIRHKIWGSPRDSLAGARNLCVENFFHEGSNLLTAVYVADSKGKFEEDEAHLVGFSYGYAGVRDKSLAFRDKDNIVFYSQYIGVKSDYQSYGLGILIKEFQKRIVRDVFGLAVISCTYDPLVSVNAYRNVHRLRMQVKEYRVACYGEYTGKLNRADVPSDRLFVTWDLKQTPEPEEYNLKKLFESGHALVLSEQAEVEGKSGPLKLEIAKGVRAKPGKKTVLIEVPFDFYTMLQETDVSDGDVRRIPLDWRTITRQSFQTLFQRGYRVLDFNTISDGNRRRGFYVLGAAVDRRAVKS